MYRLAIVLTASAVLCTGCSGKLSRRSAAEQIQSSIWVRVGANVYINLGQVERDTASRALKCIQTSSEAQPWAEKYGYVKSTPEGAFSRVSLTQEGQKLASVISTDTQNGCSNETVSFQVGTVDRVDVMEIFTDGPRAKVKFEYEIIPKNHGEDILTNNPIGATGDGAISVGEENPHNFSKSATSGSFSNFGVAFFEFSDNGWSLKSVNMDSTGG